jgi:hypothetical protein
MDVYGKTGACPGGNRDYPCIHKFIVEDIHNLGSSSNEKQAYSILHAYNPSSSIEAAEWRWAQNRDYPFNVYGVYSLIRKVFYNCMDIHKQSKKQTHRPGNLDRSQNLGFERSG